MGVCPPAGSGVRGQRLVPPDKRDKHEPLDSRDAVPSDCQACAACCFSDLETYVRVTGDDHERLGDHAEVLVWFEENRAYLRMLNGHCAALAWDDRGRFFCTVYDVRPAVCRSVQRGTPQCAGERFLKGERPRRHLALCQPTCVIA